MYIPNYADLIGIPFANRGRNKETGLDCYGLVQEFYRKFGIEVPEYYADFDDGEKIQTLISSNTQGYPWKRISEPSVPCLIAMRFGSKFVNHTGVYIGAGKFLHTRSRIGVCVDRISNPIWRKVIVGFYKYVGDADGKADDSQKSV